MRWRNLHNLLLTVHLCMIVLVLISNLVLLLKGKRERLYQL